MTAVRPMLTELIGIWWKSTLSAKKPPAHSPPLPPRRLSRVGWETQQWVNPGSQMSRFQEAGSSSLRKPNHSPPPLPHSNTSPCSFLRTPWPPEASPGRWGAALRTQLLRHSGHHSPCPASQCPCALWRANGPKWWRVVAFVSSLKMFLALLRHSWQPKTSATSKPPPVNNQELIIETQSPATLGVKDH